MTHGSWLLPVIACLTAPLLSGVINRVKATFAGRRGVPLLQLYFDLIKLFQKNAVYSKTTTVIFHIAPNVIFVSILISICMIPWGGFNAPVSFRGDIIVIIYLLGLSRFMTVLSALDTGSSFEGMGASREMFFGTLTELSVFLGLQVLAFQSGCLSISEMYANISMGTGAFEFAPVFLIACSFGVALLTENSRIPIDDPNTHLELTMIHEAMILDYSGPDLGYILYASSLKLWIFCAFIVNIFMPYQTLDTWYQIPVFIIDIIIVASIVGVIESVTARFRLLQIPKLLVGSWALGVIALILTILSQKI